jgi:hypothetical protein
MKALRIPLIIVTFAVLACFSYVFLSSYQSKENFVEEHKKANQKDDYYNIKLLRNILRDYEIDSLGLSQDSDLPEFFSKLSKDVSATYRQNVLDYMYSQKASALIDRPTSKPGILTWHIHSVIFLENDLIFGQYEDGEMEVGQLLAKIYDLDKDNIRMEILWSW